LEFIPVVLQNSSKPGCEKANKKVEESQADKKLSQQADRQAGRDHVCTDNLGCVDNVSILRGEALVDNGVKPHLVPEVMLEMRISEGIIVGF